MQAKQHSFGGLFLTFVALGLVAAWLAPNHYPPWLAAHSELMVAVSALCLGVAVFPARGAPGTIAIPWASACTFALALVPIGQLLAGQVFFFGDAWVAFLYLCCAALAIAWSSRAADVCGRNWPTALASAILCASLVSCLLAGVQRWGLAAGSLELYVVPVRPGAAPFANLAQPNQLATLLALGLASLLYFYETGCASRTVALAAATLLTFTGAMTQSRTLLLGFLVAVAWHLWFSRRIRVKTPLVVVLCLGAFWAGLFMTLPRAFESMGFFVAESAASRMAAGPRTIIWAQLWDAVLRQPWFGYGWNQVSVAQVAVAASYPRTRFVEHAHNLGLDLALWNGLPMALLVSGLSIYWLVRAARNIKSAEGAFGLLLMLLILAHAMVEFPLDYLYFLVPFAFALGIVNWSARMPVAVSAPTWTTGIATLAFGFAMVVAALDYWNVEAAFRDMRFAVARIGGPMPETPPPLLRTEFTQLAALHRYYLSVPHPGMSGAQLDWMRKVAHRYAYAPVLYRYALAQALNDDIDGSRLTLLQLRRLHGDVPYEEARGEFLRFAESRYPILRRALAP